MTLPSILIIDDEPNNFDVIETLLSVGAPGMPAESSQYQLHYAANGQEALATLDMFQPNLILLDVMMPDINGIEVCKRIKAMPKWQPVPIIMVTALTTKEDLAHCLQSGADDFISKPINGAELRGRVHSMLRIKHQYDDVQALLKLREDMVRMLVHDLRNPLTEVLLGLELLQRPKYAADRPAEKLQKIYSSARSLQGLIDDLLKMAVLESGTLRLNRKSVDLCELVKSAISDFDTIAQHKNLSLIAQSPNLPAPGAHYCNVDVTMMRRTLDNLLSNAIKFSPDDAQITVDVAVSEGGQCKLRVMDSGPGVPDKFRQKIFEKYEVGTMMSDVSQIGLGLAFCKMVVEAHGGEISVYDQFPQQEPKGAIFEINL